jgi:hypothetical protein
MRASTSMSAPIDHVEKTAIETSRNQSVLLQNHPQSQDIYIEEVC